MTASVVTVDPSTISVALTVKTPRLWGVRFWLASLLFRFGAAVLPIGSEIKFTEDDA